MRVAASRPRPHPSFGDNKRPPPGAAMDMLIGLGLLLALTLLAVMLAFAVEALGGAVWR